jgi:hypothetical protein
LDCFQADSGWAMTLEQLKERQQQGRLKKLTPTASRMEEEDDQVEGTDDEGKNEIIRAELSRTLPKDAAKVETANAEEPKPLDTTPATVDEMVDAVVSQYYPALLPSVNACLAVFGAMALAKRTKPLCLILETPSGYGKSAVLQMMFPVGEKRWGQESPW